MGSRQPNPSRMASQTTPATAKKAGGARAFAELHEANRDDSDHNQRREEHEPPRRLAERQLGDAELHRQQDQEQEIAREQLFGSEFHAPRPIR